MRDDIIHDSLLPGCRVFLARYASGFAGCYAEGQPYQSAGGGWRGECEPTAEHELRGFPVDDASGHFSRSRKSQCSNPSDNFRWRDARFPPVQVTDVRHVVDQVRDDHRCFTRWLGPHDEQRLSVDSCAAVLRGPGIARKSALDASPDDCCLVKRQFVDGGFVFFVDPS
jgi:hypothetical protein